MEQKYKITDKIKFHAIEEAFKRYVEKNKGTKEQSPTVYYREVREYTTQMVSYIIDNYKGEELCALLAHFVPKFVEEQSPKGTPIAETDLMEKVRTGLIEYLIDSRQLRAYPTATNKQVPAVIYSIKSDLLKKGRKEKGYRHERDYNAFEPGYELKDKEPDLAAKFEAQLPMIARHAKSVTLSAKTEGLGTK